MIHYAYLDFAGYVIRAGATTTLPDSAVVLPDGITGQASLDMWLVEGVFTTRPSVTEPQITTLIGNDREVVFSSLPAGTTVSVADTEAGYIIATLPEVLGSIAITLVDAGTYRIEVAPPKPWLPAFWNIEVPT